MTFHKNHRRNFVNIGFVLAVIFVCLFVFKPVVGVPAEHRALATQVFDYQLIMNRNRSLNNISMTYLYSLGTHNASSRLADAFGLVGRVSHGREWFYRPRK